MEESDKTARQIFQETKQTNRAKFGFGKKAALVNVDLQKVIHALMSLKRPIR